MQLASFRAPNNAVRTAARLPVGGDAFLVPLALAYSQVLREEGEPKPHDLAVLRLPGDMRELIAGGERSLEAARRALEWAAAQAAEAGERARLQKIGVLVPEAGVRWLPPVPRPGKVISVGINYREHIKEVAAVGIEPPDTPISFSKFPSTLIGHLEPIEYPRVSQALDYEIELSMVISKTTKEVPAEQALDSVFGYCIFNDISFRDVLLKEIRRGMLLEGKNLDSSGPMGPYLVTRDEIDDSAGSPDLEMHLTVNGDTRQRDRTSAMVFGCAELVHYWSRLTLEPGDVITTGSPAGVAMFRPDPDRWYLRPGDVVACDIEGLGRLQNSVLSSERPPH